MFWLYFAGMALILVVLIQAGIRPTPGNEDPKTEEETP